MTHPKPLTPQEQKCVEHYISGMSMSAAARKAHYTDEVARNAATTIFKRKSVVAYMEKLRSKMADKSEMSIERYLENLKEGRTLSIEMEQMNAAKGYDELLGKAMGYLTENYRVLVEGRIDLKGIVEESKRRLVPSMLGRVTEMLPGATLAITHEDGHVETLIENGVVLREPTEIYAYGRVTEGGGMASVTALPRLIETPGDTYANRHPDRMVIDAEATPVEPEQHPITRQSILQSGGRARDPHERE